MARGNGAMVRALKSSVTSLKKSETRLGEMIAAENKRHMDKLGELTALQKEVRERCDRDEAEIKRLGSSE